MLWFMVEIFKFQEKWKNKTELNESKLKYNKMPKV